MQRLVASRGVSLQAVCKLTRLWKIIACLISGPESSRLRVPPGICCCSSVKISSKEERGADPAAAPVEVLAREGEVMIRLSD